MFFPVFVGGLLNWGLRIGSGDGASLSIGALSGNMEGDSLTGDFERKVNY